MLRKILLVLLVLLIIAQFFRPAKNNGNATGPNDITKAVTVPENVRTILEKSCYDCHSNHTNYPWYSQISPVNWWLANHIKDGKSELNFTEFATYQKKKMDKKLDETAEMIEKGEMPLKSYTLIHTSSKLNDQEKKTIIDWTHDARNQLGYTSEEEE